MEEFMTGIYLLFNIFCLTAAQNQYVHVQRWTNVLVRMELTQSISDQFCYMTKNTDTIIFTILMGEMVKNIPDKRIMAVDKLVSSVVKFKINNVTYADTGQYSIVSQSDTKNFGGIRLIVTDYPITEPPSGNISSSTVGPIVAITIAIIISVIVAILLTIRRRRKNKMQPNNLKTICNGEVYADMKDSSPPVSIPPTQDNNVNIPTNQDNTVNIPTNQDNIVNIPTNQDNTVNIPTNQDNIVNIPTNQDNTVNIPTNQDNIVNIPTNQDNTVNIPTNQDNTVNITHNQDHLQTVNIPTSDEYIDITAGMKEEQQREEVYYSNKEEISQPNSEIKETTTTDLVYIEVTFDDNKKTDDDNAIQITRDICTYEEVDFTATADLANT